MSEEKLTYTLTGNFQYDLGILGLKKILDFFGFKYESDGMFYISVSRSVELLLEDIIAKLTIDNGIDYFKEKLAENINEKNNNICNIPNDNLYSKLKDIKIVSNDDLRNVYSNKNLKSLLEKISDDIVNKIFEYNSEYDINDTTKEELKKYTNDIIWQKSVNLLNNILLNFQADMNAKGPDVLTKAKEKLNSNIINGAKCSFCGKEGSKRLTRDVFFFAPAQYNTFWFNEPNLFICPACLVSNLAVTQLFTFLGNKIDAIVLYTPNIQDMETLNSTLNTVFANADSYILGKILKPIIDYEKQKIREEATIKELQIFNFRLDSKNPLMEMFILTPTSIKNLIKIENELSQLFNEGNIGKLIAFVRKKDKYIKLDFSKDILQYISQNQKIFYLVQKYVRYCIMSEIFRQDRTNEKPLVKNFSPWLFLQLIKIYYKLEDKNMNEFEKFKELGQRIRQRIYMLLTNNRTRPINWNTFDNKIISISNSFLNSSRGSLQQFQELLSRIIISTGLNVNIDTINIINKENYPEIATTIALAVLVAQSGEEREQNNNAQIEQI